MKKLLIALTLFLVLISSAAYAQQVITINAGESPYKNQTIIPGAGISADIGTRLGALTQVVSTYRRIHDPRSLPVGTVIKVTWPDGTSEKATVVSTIASTMAEPIEGSQRDAGGGGGANDPNPRSGGGGSAGIIGSGGGGVGGGSGGGVIIIIGDIKRVHDN